MAALCVLVVIVWVLLPATSLYDHRAELIAFDGEAGFAITKVGLTYSVLFAINLIFALPSLWGMLQLRRLFICYAEREIFSRLAARYLSRFALAWFVGVFSSIAGRIVRVMWLDLQEPHKFHWGFSITGGDFAAVFSAMIFTIIAWVLAEAAIVAEEHRGFV